MRFSLEPEQRSEQRMLTLDIDEIVSVVSKFPDEKPHLEHYFSPSRKDQFVRNFLHYLNTQLIESKKGNLDTDLYLVFVLNFQFTAPLLEIPAEKELGIFYRILQNNYDVEEIDINLHFSMEEYDEKMVGEAEAVRTFREELKETYEGNREVKENVQKRLKKDAIESIMSWQRQQDTSTLAEAFGRSIVIPAFFSCINRKLMAFYKESTGGITYRVAVPEELQ